MKDSKVDVDFLTSELEILRERKQYLILAIRYQIIGNQELRDKYAELALQQDPSDDSVIFLRGLQRRPNLIPPDVVKREVKRRLKFGDWSQLGRLYNTVGDFKGAVISYCRSAIQSLEQDNFFSAGFYLKEAFEEGLISKMFEEAYNRSLEKNDLWWQVRALQELGWTTELRDLLNRHRSTIEKSDNVLLRQVLYAVTGQSEKLGQERLTEAMAIESFPGFIAQPKGAKAKSRSVKKKITACYA